MITAIVIVRDQMTWMVPLVEFIARSKGVDRVILVDNESTYPPLLEWLGTCPYEVFKGDNKDGHWSPLRMMSSFRIQTPYYALTDPDLEVSTMPSDWVNRFVGLMQKYPGIKKVGPALSLQKLSEGISEWVQGIESNYWKKEVEPFVWGALIDTTLHLSKATPNYHYGPALRVSGDYEVRHLPWHLLPGECPQDVEYYFRHAGVYSTNREKAMELIK